MREVLEGKEIMVIGRTGSIGSKLVAELLRLEVRKIAVFSRDEIKRFIMRKMINDKRLRFVIGDIRDYKSLQRVFKDNSFELVYHTATMKHVIVCEENHIEAVKTNIIGSQKRC